MDFYLFDRKDVIRHFEDLSILNGKKKISDCEELVMSENEKFVFQIAVLPKENCTVSLNKLYHRISGYAIVCISAWVL